MSTKDVKSIRTRNFATIVYPDSAPADWLTILSDFHIPCFVSPFHDSDITANGEKKKSHYHVLLCFDSVKTVEQASEIFVSIGGVGCEIVKSMRAYARYLCHLDDPNKHQYNVSDVLSLSGAIYLDVIQSASDRYAAIEEMMDFCDKYNVCSFYLLSRYARQNRSDWFRILCDSGTVYLKEFLKSREWSLGRGQDHIIDSDTGEVII